MCITGSIDLSLPECRTSSGCILTPFLSVKEEAEDAAEEEDEEEAPPPFSSPPPPAPPPMYPDLPLQVLWIKKLRIGLENSYYSIVFLILTCRMRTKPPAKIPCSEAPSPLPPKPMAEEGALWRPSKGTLPCDDCPPVLADASSSG